MDAKWPVRSPFCQVGRSAHKRDGLHTWAIAKQTTLEPLQNLPTKQPGRVSRVDTRSVQPTSCWISFTLGPDVLTCTSQRLYRNSVQQAMLGTRGCLSSRWGAKCTPSAKKGIHHNKKAWKYKMRKRSARSSTNHDYRPFRSSG
jgi:hypothetical protein